MPRDVGVAGETPQKLRGSERRQRIARGNNGIAKWRWSNREVHGKGAKGDSRPRPAPNNEEGYEGDSARGPDRRHLSVDHRKAQAQPRSEPVGDGNQRQPK